MFMIYFENILVYFGQFFVYFVLLHSIYGHSGQLNANRMSFRSTKLDICRLCPLVKCQILIYLVAKEDPF